MGAIYESSGGSSSGSVAAVQVVVDSIETKVDTIDNLLDTEIGALTTAVGVIDDLLDTEIAALTTAVGVIDDLLDNEITAIQTTLSTGVGAIQQLTWTGTVAANASVQTIGTVTGIVNILSVCVYADAAAHANLTDVAVKVGDVGTENVIIDPAVALANKFTALSKQMNAGGAWHCRTGDLLTFLTTGTGSGTTAWRVIVRYEAGVAGGVMA